LQTFAKWFVVNKIQLHYVLYSVNEKIATKDFRKIDRKNSQLILPDRHLPQNAYLPFGIWAFFENMPL